jgi:cytochrome oxidase Cu insertion factor (SCO1/SenC/PrrC family)/thiol-disulfide isomerase/thioredoxin
MTARFARWLLLLMVVATAPLAMAGPPPAFADGDPGSDVLLAQNLFYGAQDGVSLHEELALGKLLNATSAAGAPVRVAIIGRQQDLGTVTPLWGKPQTYAGYLGTELSDTYTGRLLVVMPSGYGVYWNRHDQAAASLASALAGLHVSGVNGPALVAATQSAVERIEAAAGISRAALARRLGSAQAASALGPAAVNATGTPSPSAAATTNTAHAGNGGSGPPVVLLLIVVLLIGLAYVATRRGWWRGLKRISLRPIALLPAALLLIIVLALVVNQGGGSSALQPVSDLRNNPDLDPGTQMNPVKPAPGFTLTDETGKQISLKQYRGKVVILSFVDDECQTLCPLTTQAMVDAQRMLGPAASDVQLLGVNANWKSLQVDDVLNYTEVHGLSGHWHFLTSVDLRQLEKIWKEYGVDERALVTNDSNQIDHVAATFIIDPEGRLRTLYTTSPSYASIPQLGQLMARDASRLLPSHPKVDADYSYAHVTGTTPTQTATLPRAGGGIAADLSSVDDYAKSAAGSGLPSLTAVDEGSVEPSPGALPAFLKTLPKPLSYPVAIDQTGKLADGYEVQGEPSFVLTNAAGHIVWYQEAYTGGWPTLTQLKLEVKAALAKPQKTPTAAALDGSPAPLAALHAQSAQLLPGGSQALRARTAQLRGYPVVINIWASWCEPCQEEFGLFKNASLAYGKHVAFLGADNADEDANAQVFLHSHAVAYPSYATQTDSLNWLLTDGLVGTPETVFLSPSGTVRDVHIGQYASQGSLDADIQAYALGPSS